MAVHQAFEYWHPYAQKWIIVDPYYGVCFVNSSGEFLGFDGLIDLIMNESFSVDLITHVEVNPFYYSEEELLSVMNDMMVIGNKQSFFRGLPH